MVTRSYALFCVGATVWGLLTAEISVAQDFEIVPIAEVGDIMPGTGGSSVGLIYVDAMHAAISVNGTVVWSVPLVGTGPAAGIFRRNADGSTSALALSGDPAPGTGGGSFDLTTVIDINDSDVFLFHATIAGGSATEGLFVHAGGAVSKAVATGDVAPDTGGGSFSSIPKACLGFDVYFCNVRMLNASGDIVFLGNVVGGTSSVGIFLASGGTISSVALEGQATVGPEISVYEAFDHPSISDRGEIVFSAGSTRTYSDDGCNLSPITVLEHTVYRFNLGPARRIALPEFRPLGGLSTICWVLHPRHANVNGRGVIHYDTQCALNDCQNSIGFGSYANQEFVWTDGNRQRVPLSNSPDLCYSGGGDQLTAVLGDPSSLAYVALTQRPNSGSCSIYLFFTILGFNGAYPTSNWLGRVFEGPSADRWDYAPLNAAYGRLLYADLSGIYLATATPRALPALSTPARIGLGIAIVGIGVLATSTGGWGRRRPPPAGDGPSRRDG